MERVISWWKLEEKEGLRTLVNADPVKHGRWVPVKHGLYMCTVCDVYIQMVMEEFDYCPFCGAKMDG